MFQHLIFGRAIIGVYFNFTFCYYLRSLWSKINIILNNHFGFFEYENNRRSL